MSIVIRLARFGKRHHPIYRITVADSRRQTTGRFLQQIGQYNPNQHPPAVTIDEESAIAWLEKGAQPSDSVQSLLKKKGILKKVAEIRRGKKAEEVTAEPIAWKEPKSKPSKKVQEKNKAEEEAKAKAAEEAAAAEAAAKAEAEKPAEESAEPAAETKE